jgi:GAF domain-containing protein
MVEYGDPYTATTLLAMGRRVQELVPECVGLSLALLDDGLTLTLVASDLRAAGVDAAQYLEGGPCVAAVDERRSISVTQDDLLDEHHWQMYAQVSAAAGIASSLSLPILADGLVIGSVNLYASTGDAFDGHHEELAAALDSDARHAITNADLTFSTRLKAAEAPMEYADQQDVDLATGIIAGSQDVDVTTARTRLQQAAAQAGITEAQAARALKGIHLS